MVRPRWWRDAVLYQIYPRSWADDDGDGVGDLPGITARLDHLAWLGVDGLWLSPIHPSPMADFGYDVADYTDIEPLFGTLADFDALVTAAHDRGLRVILDYVPNHTSDVEPWLPLTADADTRNVAAQRDDPASELHLVRDLLALRADRPSLRSGAYEEVAVTDELFAYARTTDAERTLVVLSFADRSTSLPIDGRHKILRSTISDRHGTVEDALSLAPYEAIVLTAT
ncbi:hypothetical protein BH23ACT10_BH23ACT10_02490 [soil metagenome]